MPDIGDPDMTYSVLLTAWEVTSAVVALGLLTLFWVSKRKSIVTDAVALVIIIRIVWLFGSPWLLRNLHAEVSPGLGTIANLTAALLLFTLLYEQICLVDEPPAEKYFDFLSPWTLVVPALFLFTSWTLLDLIQLDDHFALAWALTIVLAWITRKTPTNETLFQIFAVVVVLVWTGLFIADPFIYGYREDTELDMDIFAKSLAYNAGWAFAPILFFLGNMCQKGLLSKIDNRKVFKYVFFIWVGSLFYRDPLVRDFVGKLPIFDKFVPASLGATALLLAPGIAFIRTVRRKDSANMPTCGKERHKNRVQSDEE